MGEVIGIGAQEFEDSLLVVYASAKVSFENGIGDDYRGLKKNGSEVSIMTVESWKAVCEELGARLHWTVRNSNILIEGVDLENSKGDILKIGNFYIEITGENIPTDKMEEQFIGLKKALIPNWRGGVIGKVLAEGIVNEGDSVVLGERS